MIRLRKLDPEELKKLGVVSGYLVRIAGQPRGVAVNANRGGRWAVAVDGRWLENTVSTRHEAVDVVMAEVLA